jgi:beta-lactamase class A
MEKTTTVPAVMPRAPRRAGRIALSVALLLAAYALALPDTTSTATRPRQVASLPPPPPPQWEQLEESVGRLRSSFRGVVAFYIEDLQTGRTIAYNENLAIPAASLIKLPLAVSLFEQEIAGKISLDAEVTLKSSDKANGSGILRRYPPGTRLTVMNLLELMIQRSDNTATNILTDLISLDEINGSCRRQGLGATCMPRYIMDLEARDKAKIENYTSAADMARVLKALYSRKVLDPPSCARLIDVLKGQHVQDRLPRYLPPGVAVAHKTGLMNGLCHDAGIIYGQNHDYVVAVLTADFPSFGYAKDAIGRVARMVYQYDTGSPLTAPKLLRQRKPVPPKPIVVARRAR